MNRQILKIALPAIVSNITVPLLGLVDVAITGHLGSAVYMAAIAVGAMIFNLVYWIFGFLRMSTTGLTSQAYGRNDLQETLRLRRQAVTVALFLAAVILLLQWPLRELMLWLMSPTADVVPHVRTYYNICVWGAPAMLASYSLTGWFIGMQDTRVPMVVSIVQNVVNIALSLFLVFGLQMKIEGVALGTVIAQYAGAAVLVLSGQAQTGRMLGAQTGTAKEKAKDESASPLFALSRFLSVSFDIFLRTLCLVAVNLWFTAAGARQGAVVLAVNTLLMQLYLLFSYVMDGFAYAGEALCGRYVGAQDPRMMRLTVRRLFAWGAGMTVLFTAVYVAGGTPFLAILTNEESVIAASAAYLHWAWLIPAAGVAAFIWDGVFIGTTFSRGMLVSSFLAALLFFGLYAWLAPRWGNHALWMAFIGYLVARGLIQGMLYPRLLNHRFGSIR